MAFSTPSWQAMPQTTLMNAVSGFRHHATLCLGLGHKVTLSRCALFLSWAIMGNHGRFLTTDYNVWFLELLRRGSRRRIGSKPKRRGAKILSKKEPFLHERFLSRPSTSHQNFVRRTACYRDNVFPAYPKEQQFANDDPYVVTAWLNSANLGSSQCGYIHMPWS